MGGGLGGSEQGGRVNLNDFLKLSSHWESFQDIGDLKLPLGWTWLRGVTEPGGGIGFPSDRLGGGKTEGLLCVWEPSRGFMCIISCNPHSSDAGVVIPPIYTQRH